MKQKIKEALKQKYGTRANKELGQLQLGIGDEVFERVAASVETFITDESQIDAFVQSESTLNLLKSYQSVNDRLRAIEGKTPKNEPTPTPSDNGNQPNPNPEPTPQPDLASAIASAVAEQMKAVVTPLQEKLTLFEAEKAIEGTIADVNTRIDAWGYGKGYPKEMEKARKHAMELYEAYGKKWTADELEAKIKEKFNAEVHDKGIDTTQPFKGDGGGSEADADFSSFDRAAQELGWAKPDK